MTSYHNKQKLISQREQEVLFLIAHEHSTKEIASKLNVCYETAHSHRKSLLKKLNAKNTAGLIRISFEYGLMKVNRSCA